MSMLKCCCLSAKMAMFFGPYHHPCLWLTREGSLAVCRNFLTWNFLSDLFSKLHSSKAKHFRPCLAYSLFWTMTTYQAWPPNYLCDKQHKQSSDLAATIREQLGTICTAWGWNYLLLQTTLFYNTTDKTILLNYRQHYPNICQSQIKFKYDR